MYDFACVDAADMHNKVLADRVRYFKEDEEGVAIMCREMEKMRNEAHEEGRAEMAVGMYDKGVSVELIAQIAKTSVEHVLEWLRKAGRQPMNL